MIGLVEPRTSVLDHYQVIGGRNLGNAANLRMKVINPSPHDVIIPSGTSIAYYVCESALQLPLLRLMPTESGMKCWRQ